MPPYTPQQQFLAADQNPQDPQFSAQDHFFGALLRLLFLRIAEELSPAELEHFMTLELNAPRAFQLLHEHNERRYSRLVQKHRNGGQQAAPAAGTSRRRADGSVDAFNQNDATARTRAIFAQALGKKGGR